MGFKETVIGLAEKVGDTVDKGIKTGKDSYNKMAEKSRIKKEMTQLNTEITDIFSSVGRRLYNESPENEQFKSVFDEVKSKEEKIAELKQQLSVLEGATVCSVCGEIVQKGELACPKCGAKAEEEPAKAEVEIVEAEEVVYCSQCGAKLSGSAKFCNQCGAKVSE